MYRGMVLLVLLCGMRPAVSWAFEEVATLELPVEPANIACIGKTVYYDSWEGSLYAFDLETLRPKWECVIHDSEADEKAGLVDMRHYGLDQKFAGSVDGVVYGASSHPVGLWKIDASSGKIFQHADIRLYEAFYAIPIVLSGHRLLMLIGPQSGVIVDEDDISKSYASFQFTQFEFDNHYPLYEPTSSSLILLSQATNIVKQYKLEWRNETAKAQLESEFILGWGQGPFSAELLEPEGLAVACTVDGSVHTFQPLWEHQGEFQGLDNLSDFAVMGDWLVTASYHTPGSEEWLGRIAWANQKDGVKFSTQLPNSYPLAIFKTASPDEAVFYGGWASNEAEAKLWRWDLAQNKLLDQLDLGYAGGIVYCEALGRFVIADYKKVRFIDI
jgi:hypothetical protein